MKKNFPDKKLGPTIAKKISNSVLRYMSFNLMSLKRLNVEKIQAIYFPKSSSYLNNHFSLELKGCAYYEKSAYYEWGQYLRKLYLDLSRVIIHL